MRRSALLAIAVLISLACTACGHDHRYRSGDAGAEAALSDYLRHAPASVTDVGQDGAIVRVSCGATDQRYRQGRVFDCSMFHTSDAEYVWCVAMVDGKLVTQNEDRDVPCTGFPESPIESGKGTVTSSAGARHDQPSEPTPPRIAGSAVYRHTLTTMAGTGATQGVTRAFQWQRCKDALAGLGNACSDIADATGSTYRLIAADAGSRIRVVETASTADGVASVVSGRTPPVVAFLTYEEAQAAGLPVPPLEFGPICPDDTNWQGYATVDELEAAIAVAPEEPTCMDDPTEDLFEYGMPESTGPARAWSGFGP